MNKKLVAALSGGAALVLALTGCGGESGNKKLDNWAKKICDQMPPQVKRIQDANHQIAGVQTDEDSKKVQETDSAAFQTNVDAYKSLAAVVQNAGAPPVKGGEANQKDAVKALEDLSGSYAELKKRIDALDVNNKSQFGESLKGIAADIGKLGGKSDDALKKLQSGDVGKAMAKHPGCQKTPATPSAK
ncbi:small secreted protein [Streptomyces gamaensis]|uniref:Small secreted protein n=1 Tax=Streptomyces gamaensis TaxID=1763542 RepID=A0ABW0Z6D7_9ACTN